MTNLYNFDAIKTELEKTIHKEKALLQVWQNVKFLTKKDGTPFATMSKNFEGCKYTRKDNTLQEEYEISINFWDDRLGYIGDTINCYTLVKYLSKDDPRKEKIENYQTKQTFLEQIYKFDLDDIKQAISERIEYYKKEIEKNEKDLKNLYKLYSEFETKYNAAIKELENNCNSKTVFYNIKNCITR